MNKETIYSMVRIFIVTTIIGMVVILSGCDGFRIGNAFLEKPASEGVNKDTVFSNATFATELLTHAYETMFSGIGQPGAYDTRLMGDNAQLSALTDINEGYNTNNGAPQVYYYTGTYSADVEADDPTSMKYNFSDGQWSGIRDSYLFLENVDKVPNFDPHKKRRLKGEAWMIIAYHYARMFRNYGGMFWVDHVYKSDEDFDLPRMTAMATLDSIVAVIDRAIPKLPFYYPPNSPNLGRFTAAGAMGLKCRVLLFGASPLFNSNQPYLAGEAATKNLVWYGSYHPEMWQRAADACHDFLQENKERGMPYHLVQPENNSLKAKRLAFRHGYYDRDSPELIIQVRKGYKGQGGANGFPGSVINEGTACTTDNYVKMFSMADGTPIDKSGSGYDPSHPYEDRDPRLYETVLVNGMPYYNRKAQLWIGGKEHRSKNFRKTRTGYREYKFALDLRLSQGHPMEWPTLRLSEIYLSYAEALNEVNGHPTAKAYKYVNKVRNRVGLKNLQKTMKDPSSQEEFRKAVIRERVLELGYERVRWFDMVRWKMKDVFTKTLYGMRICKKGTPAAADGDCKDFGGYGRHESSKFIYTRFKLPTRYWAKHFSPKWYLSAFPTDEINKGYGIIQNPGW